MIIEEKTVLMERREKAWQDGKRGLEVKNLKNDTFFILRLSCFY